MAAPAVVPPAGMADAAGPPATASDSTSKAVVVVRWVVVMVLSSWLSIAGCDRLCGGRWRARVEYWLAAVGSGLGAGWG